MFDRPPTASEGAVDVVESEAPQPATAETPLITDGVLHAENCTRKEYWSRHYDECFPDGSEIYRRPVDPGADDSGFILYETPVLYLDRNQPR